MNSETVEIHNLVPSTDLTPAREAWLVNGLVEALPNLKMRELFSLRRDMFTEADLVTVAVSQPGVVVGALSSKWVTSPTGDRFLHVTTQFVGDGYRHGVVFRQSWTAHLTALCGDPSGFPPLIVLKTYNPRVFCAMQSFAQVPGVSFYPTVDGDKPNAEAARLAGHVARTIAPEYPFNPVTGVISGVGVPHDLYPDLPMSKNAVVNDFFAGATRPGDRVLCMLMVSMSQAASAVMQYFAQPRRSPAA